MLYLVQGEIELIGVLVIPAAVFGAAVGQHAQHIHPTILEEGPHAVVEAVRRVSGRDVRVEEAPRRPGDPPVLVGSAEKIKKELGWEPCHLSLDEMVQTAYQWHSTHPDGFGKG